MVVTFMLKEFLTNSDVCLILGVKRSCSQKIIQSLNDELREKGFKTIRGRINKKYFMERYFLDDREIERQLFRGNDHELQKNA